MLDFMWLLFSMSRPPGTMGWYVVCCISLSYSLNFSYVKAVYPFDLTVDEWNINTFYSY